MGVGGSGAEARVRGGGCLAVLEATAFVAAKDSPAGIRKEASEKFGILNLGAS